MAQDDDGLQTTVHLADVTERRRHISLDLTPLVVIVASSIIAVDSDVTSAMFTYGSSDVTVTSQQQAAAAAAAAAVLASYTWRLPGTIDNSTASSPYARVSDSDHVMF